MMERCITLAIWRWIGKAIIGQIMMKIAMVQSTPTATDGNMLKGSYGLAVVNLEARVAAKRERIQKVASATAIQIPNHLLMTTATLVIWRWIGKAIIGRITMNAATAPLTPIAIDVNILKGSNGLAVVNLEVRLVARMSAPMSEVGSHISSTVKFQAFLSATISM